jgi:hypothetical protein
VLAAPARGADVQLWPLFRYHSDASRRHSLHLLGPLVTYESGPEAYELTVRPLFSFTRGPEAGHSELAVLYPVWISRWTAEESKHRFVGLISLQSQNAQRPDEWDRRFTIFPLVFYRYNRALGTQLAVLPFYADLRDFFGYERIHTIAFPFYLHLKLPLVVRTWMPFPFYSRTGGRLGRGFRIWPFYGWDEEGEQKRFTYIMWPFYISYERHFSRPEHERRLISFPLFSRIDSPSVRSRSYLGPFFTHTTDRDAHTDTWGFPWPLWVSQRDLKTGQRTSLRLAPFYEDTQQGDVHRGFILWPAYRWKTQEMDSYRYDRSDVLLALGRKIDELEPQYRHQRHLRTVFPFFRNSAEDADEEFSTLALLDALYPRNPTVERLYAPLWQVYSRRQRGDQPPRWSVLWDLISSDGKQTRYPVYLDLGQ